MPCRAMAHLEQVVLCVISPSQFLALGSLGLPRADCVARGGPDKDLTVSVFISM